MIYRLDPRSRPIEPLPTQQGDECRRLSGPPVSPDGRFVAFRSAASNLVVGDTNGVWDVFMRDRQVGQTRRINVRPDGQESTASVDSPAISMTPNGSYVAFTSADGLSRMRETKRKRYLTYYDDEHPIAAQLFGSNPETLADSARIVEDAGFDIVDLNLGCPAKRVVKCNGGSGLLRDLPLIRTIFEEVRKVATIPFTVKFRLGWDDDQIV